jgi:hypothetical protein
LAVLASVVDKRPRLGPNRIVAARMLPLYAARLSDLGPGDFVKVACAACPHVASLTLEELLRMGLSPATKVLDLKEAS